VHEQVEAAERLPRLAHDPLHVVVRAHVALGDERARNALPELAHALLDPLALVRERELGAFFGEAARDRPRDRPFVGDTEDEATFPFEAIHGSRS
jgi:hypothetical protein